MLQTLSKTLDRCSYYLKYHENELLEKNMEKLKSYNQKIKIELKKIKVEFGNNVLNNIFDFYLTSGVYPKNRLKFNNFRHIYDYLNHYSQLTSELQKKIDHNKITTLKIERNCTRNNG